MFYIRVYHTFVPTGCEQLERSRPLGLRTPEMALGALFNPVYR